MNYVQPVEQKLFLPAQFDDLRWCPQAIATRTTMSKVVNRRRMATATSSGAVRVRSSKRYWHQSLEPIG